MKGNKFSIIIPLYNKEKFIKTTINSVLSQSYDNYEIIIVDDCSTDNSYEIVEELKLMKGIKISLYKNKKNAGVSFSRNHGIKYASGDYIIFLDADDEFSDELFLRNMNDFIKKYNAEYIMVTRDYYGKKIKPKLRNIQSNLLEVEKNFYRIKNKTGLSFQGSFPFGGSASAVISKKIITNKFFNINETRFEDWLFFFDILNSTDKAYFYSKNCVKINDDLNSLSKQKTKKSIIEFPEFYNYLSQNKEFHKLRKRFFWIWFAGEIRTIKRTHLKVTFRTYKSEILRNLSINKYSLYCFSILLLSTLKNGRKNE